MNKKIFFGHGTVGLMGKEAHTAALTFLNEYFAIGPPEVLAQYEPYPNMLRDEVGHMLHCDSREITYIKNTTEGINIATEALPLRVGDEVLLLGNEYPAGILPWLKKRKEGIDVQIISGIDNEKAFEELMLRISAKTKVVSISWAQYYDGYMADLDRLSRVCRKFGTFLVVDAVQAVGIRELSLLKTSVDILVCGGQKYLGSIMGIGFMYVNTKIMRSLKDTKVGIRSMKRFREDSYELKDGAERFEDGTQNLLGIVALHAAIKQINAIGVPAIEKESLALLEAFKEVLRKHQIPYIDHKRQSNILALRIDRAEELCKYLRESNIVIKPIKDIARISFVHTSTLADFHVLVAQTHEWLKRHPNA